MMRVPLARLLSVSFGFCGFIAAQSTITTTFASNNGGADGGAVHFDLQVTNPAGIAITRFDLNVANPPQNGTIEVYTTNAGGTHVGNQIGPAPGTWLLRATANVTTVAPNGATVATLNKSIVLPMGTYGVTLAHLGCAARYTGTAATPPTQTVFANGDITLTLGTAQNVAFTSAVFSPRVANLTIYYGLLATDVVDFTADVVSGSGPLAVNFTDRSFSSLPVTGWEWDFNNDSIVDSTLQNPATVYPTCGDFSPRLRLLRGANPPVELVWTDLIEVDPVRADFTATPDTGAPPLNVQFTDTSVGPATAWAWDFDDDGITDSTQQNPLFVFAPGCHKVTLTATRNCHTSTVSKRVNAVNDTFTTMFNGGTLLIANQGMVFFDLTVTATERLSICGVDINTATAAGKPCAMEVWLTDTTWVGKHQMPDLWRRVATGTGTTAGGNVPTQAFLDRPILLLPGRTYGVAIRHLDSSPQYLNPGAVIANADLSLTPGAVAGTGGGPFTGGLNQPRQWIGSLHYLRESLWPQGAITWFASGCAGSLGVPRIEPQGTSRPQLGTTTTLQVTNMPVSAGFMVLGLSDTTSVFGPLPLDLTFFGMPGCFGRVSTDSTTFLLGAGNTASFNLTLPGAASLAGIRFFTQAIVPSPGTNAFGAVMSDSLAGLTGLF